MGVRVHFHIHPNFPLIETSEAMIVVQESAHEDADVIFGTSTDETLPENYVKITIIATGFEKNLKMGSNNENFINDSAMPVVKTRPRLVMGGDFDGSHLDIPSYMRQQQD
jgi:cell division protein FtsZ